MSSEGSADRATAMAAERRRAAVDELCKHFAIPEGVNLPVAKFENQISSTPGEYREIGTAFCFNIRALLSTICIPYSLAMTSALDRHYQRISSAEGIRALKLEQLPGETVGELEKRRAAAAQPQIDVRMEAFLGSEEGRNALVDDVCGFLLRSVRSEPFALAARELLLQGVVLCWGAFEVLSRDTFVAFLNLNPKSVASLALDAVAKRRFELSRVSFDTLSAHGFDLSAKMGTLLAEQQDLSDLNTLKAVFGALFPLAVALRESLDDPDLRLLSQRRNLVVHRRGAVDESYVKTTGCKESVGDRLRVSPDDVERHVGTVARCGTALLRALETSAGTNEQPGR